MAVHFVIFASQGCLKSELNKTISDQISQSTKHASPFTVEGSDRLGWYVQVDDLDLVTDNVEIRSMGCLAGAIKPISGELYVVPLEWVNIDILKRHEHLTVPVENNEANKAWESYTDRSEGKTYYYMGGISMFAEEPDDE